MDGCSIFHNMESDLWDQIPLSVRVKELQRDTGKHGLNQCRVNLCMQCQNGVWVRCFIFSSGELYIYCSESNADWNLLAIIQQLFSGL